MVLALLISLCLEWEVTKARVAKLININCPVAVVTALAQQLATFFSRVVRVAHPLLLHFLSLCNFQLPSYVNQSESRIQKLCNLIGWYGSSSCNWGNFQVFHYCGARIDWIKWHVAVQAITTSYIFKQNENTVISPPQSAPPGNLKPWAPLLLP